MPESISKLQPDRTISLRGFDGFGAAAAIHSTTPDGFTVSGVFRDPSDFAVLVLWDADDYYGHPRIKYLPDMDFSGMVLSFDLLYRNLAPIDTPKFPTIDFPYLDITKADGSAAQIKLFDNATLTGGTFTPASGTFTINTPGVAGGDRLTLWFQNIAFDYFGVDHSGDTAAQAAATIANQINTTNWAGIGGLLALQAVAVQNAITIYVALYGTVNTSGSSVSLASGNQFTGLPAGATVTINGVQTTVVSVSARSMVVSDDLGSQTGVPYLAPRGGYDGNMVTMYSGSQTPNLTTDLIVKMSGGSSDAVWRVSIDFTALGIDQVRQMWLTLAPRLSDSAAYQDEEWDATFTNWAVSDPNGKRALKVAGPNSVRIEETDIWTKFAGSGWSSTSVGWFSQGFAKVTSHVGDSVTVTYYCSVQHDLWLGTSLYKDRGIFGVALDSGAESTLDMYLNNEPAVNTRRKLRSSVASGNHTVKLTLHGMNNLASSGTYAYFDFIEAVVVSDVPDPLTQLTKSSPAIDYDTDHGYKLPPARLMWMFDKLGFSGPMNEYIGVFWWNQRKGSGGKFPSAVVTLSGAFVDQDQIFLNIGGSPLGKTVFPNESNATIANHLAYFINETYSGVWAAAGVDGSGNQTVTITARSAATAYAFTFSASATLQSGSTGAVKATGSLEGGTLNQWIIDTAAEPVVNYAARLWHADLYSEVVKRGGSIVSAFSMELVNSPDKTWPAMYPDGTLVATDTGFSSLISNHCHPGAQLLAYQQRAFLAIAGLQAAAGLTPWLQCGEFLWWFFAKTGVGMGYYDVETQAAAQATLGRTLKVFLDKNDDPGANGFADAIFLRNQLRDHVAGIVAFVKAAYPNALFEVLYPYDVNHPTPAGRYNNGGRLNNYVNSPPEWKQPGTLDLIKIEALDWGASSRDLNLAIEAMKLPFTQWQWPKAKCAYLFPCFNPGTIHMAEQAAANNLQIPSLIPFAFDHVNLIGWDLTAKLLPTAQVA